MQQVKIYGYLNESTVEPFTIKNVATQREGYIAIEQLKKLGCKNIVANFDELETLPKDYDELDHFNNFTISRRNKKSDFSLDDIIFIENLVERYANELSKQNNTFKSLPSLCGSVINLDLDLIVKCNSIISRLKDLYENK